MAAAFDFLSTVKQSDPFGQGSKPLIGKVISNKDPKMLGRIKVSIPYLIPWSLDDGEDSDLGATTLPWIYPVHEGFSGTASGKFEIPEVDSSVICEFPYKSIYAGFYTGSVVDSGHRSINFMSEYGDRYGFEDSLENRRIVNKNARVNAIETRLSDGTLTIEDNKDSTLTITDLFGTSIFIDRKNQSAVLEFGGLELTLSANGVRVYSPNLTVGSDNLTLSGSQSVNIVSPSVTSSSPIVSSEDK